MVFIEQKNNDYIVFLDSKLDIDISKVYNQMFFSIYPLKRLRVFKDKHFIDEKNRLEDVNLQEEDEETIESENYEDKIINVFGKEKLPNNYSELPLKQVEHSDQSDSFEEQKNEEDGFYNGLSGYLTKYLPSMFSKNNDDINNGTRIFIPYDIENPIYTVDELLTSYSYNDSLIISNNITYDLLHEILRDIYIQVDYLRNNNYYFSEFDITKIVRVQGRYVYFNSNNLNLIKEGDDYKKDLNKGILNLIRDLLQLNNDNEVIEQLKNIQNTQIYYYIKRIEREGYLIWV